MKKTCHFITNHSINKCYFISREKNRRDKLMMTFFKSSRALSKRNPKCSLWWNGINAPQAPLFRGENTGLGDSKYDKDIVWDADIDPNDVQGFYKEIS
jgi:hypothetical protein